MSGGQPQAAFNAELTGAARLYRAASELTAGLAKMNDDEY